MRADRVAVAGVLVAGVVAAVSVAPGETFARGGGGGFGGHGFAGRSMGFHGPVVRPLAQFHHGFRGPERRRLGLGLFPFGGVYYGGGYGPSEYIEPVPVPAAAEPEITGAVPPPPVYRSFTPYIPYRAGCTRETVEVPSESGGEREIHIVRC